MHMCKDWTEAPCLTPYLKQRVQDTVWKGVQQQWIIWEKSCILEILSLTLNISIIWLQKDLSISSTTGVSFHHDWINIFIYVCVCVCQFMIQIYVCNIYGITLAMLYVKHFSVFLIMSLHEHFHISFHFQWCHIAFIYWLRAEAAKPVFKLYSSGTAIHGSEEWKVRVSTLVRFSYPYRNDLCVLAKADIWWKKQQCGQCLFSLRSIYGTGS